MCYGGINELIGQILLTVSVLTILMGIQPANEYERKYILIYWFSILHRTLMNLTSVVGLYN